MLCKPDIIVRKSSRARRMQPAGDVTRLLNRWREGERAAFDEVIAITYPRLRELADAFLRRELSGHTIQATGLVHELYMVLLKRHTVGLENRQHFYSLVAMLMRNILCDRA